MSWKGQKHGMHAENKAALLSVKLARARGSSWSRDGLCVELAKEGVLLCAEENMRASFACWSPSYWCGVEKGNRLRYMVMSKASSASGKAREVTSRPRWHVARATCSGKRSCGLLDVMMAMVGACMGLSRFLLKLSGGCVQIWSMGFVGEEKMAMVVGPPDWSMLWASILT